MTESRKRQRRQALENLNRGRALLKQSSEAHDGTLAELSQRREALSGSLFGTQDPRDAEAQVLGDLDRLDELRQKSRNTKPLWPPVLLFLLTISHSGVSGLFTRAWKIEKILHWLQTGYGKNPCKGFGG